MLKVMNEAAEESGRDPSALELSLGGALSTTTEESVAEAAKAGAHRLVVSPSQSTELAAVCDEMSAFAERIHLQPMS
jgi:2-keto-3-deoxy-6-phosphogluconate aldolase